MVDKDNDSSMWLSCDLASCVIRINKTTDTNSTAQWFGHGLFSQVPVKFTPSSPWYFSRLKPTLVNDTLSSLGFDSMCFTKAVEWQVMGSVSEVQAQGNNRGTLIQSAKDCFRNQKCPASIIQSLPIGVQFRNFISAKSFQTIFECCGPLGAIADGISVHRGCPPAW